MKLDKIDKIETVQIHFLSEVLDCCYLEISLPRQHDVTTSPLYLLSENIEDKFETCTRFL